MPFYSFECAQCQKRFDELVAYEKREQVTCPDCHSAARVLVAGFAVQGSSSGKVASAAPARPRFT